MYNFESMFVSYTMPAENSKNMQISFSRRIISDHLLHFLSLVNANCYFKSCQIQPCLKSGQNLLIFQKMSNR